ncbi:carboxy terminal-processing peptidase [Taylorella equigenitalis]|uniref:Tail-specific protease n=3 Tax=Taylorella equigenitalis TaxID=29575 RepID=A0A654KJK6_TAYEM|nr:carboxy terminal-processing peptidase [Taylorella equigenitalis]ADU92076.1 Tail-specific protease precursor [Taylorella equigenitalis MCE9]AFN35637.1 carboxyl-terminal protease [Taylorella equigenitalis ATCC 35865]ASY30289.1 tail-specific protease [Taylorella equigenitalis]ASY37592.1 tail-specific protease [Taylorella equigenitalis]ASY39061.1 tail-specific protease [Taylorella equigenitalis]
MKLNHIFSSAILSFSVLALPALAQTESTDNTFKPAKFKELEFKENYARATILSALIFDRFQYEKKPFDSKLQSLVFENLFKSLDTNKMIFTKEDIASFKKYESQILNYYKKGQLQIGFEIFNLYKHRLVERYDYAISLLNNGFDFSKNEEFIIDREDLDWPATHKEANDLWRKRIKNDYLRLKLANVEDEKIKTTLRKRYINRRNTVARMDGEQAAEYFINSLGDSLDPHTTYYSPSSAKNFDVTISLSVEGIGAVLQKHFEYGQIREVVAGGPAAKSKLINPGDLIVGVAQGDDGAFEDVIDWELDDIVKKIRGKRGSTVRIQLIPAGSGLDGKPKEVKIVREKVSMEEQAARSKVIEAKTDGKTHKVGVITIPSFYEDFDAQRAKEKDFNSLSKDISKFLDEYKKNGVEALVLDLRNNGGGSLNEAAKVSGLFIGNREKVVQVSTQNGEIKMVESRGVEQLWDKPVVVVINRFSASASEILAAAIKDYGRGVIVGSQTWGKGTVQTFRDLKDFLRNDAQYTDLGAVKWTIQKFFRVNGSSTQLKGVEPDIEFPSSVDKEKLGESSYDNPLPWTILRPADFKPFADLKESIAKLNTLHKDRVEKSGSWSLLKKENDFRLKLSQRKTYSLNFDARKKEREEMDAQIKAFDKEREELGEINFNDLKLDDGLARGEGDLNEELADEKKRKENLDTIARESANIAADMISVTSGIKFSR